MQTDDGKAPEGDAARERASVTEHSGSPFPDPKKPRRTPDAEVVPGQPMPSTDRPDDGGVTAVRR